MGQTAPWCPSSLCRTGNSSISEGYGPYTLQVLAASKGQCLSLSLTCCLTNDLNSHSQGAARMAPLLALSNRNCLVCLGCPLSELVPHSPFMSASRTLPGARLRRRVQGSARGRGGGSRHLLLLALSRWRSLFLSLTTSVSSQSCKISEFFFSTKQIGGKPLGFGQLGKRDVII